MKIDKRKIIIFFFLLFYLIQIYSEENIILIPENLKSYLITDQMYYYTDQTNSISFNQILSLDEWIDIEIKAGVLPCGSKDIWLKFSVQKETPETVYLRFNNYYYSEIDFYYQDQNGDWQVIKTGNNRPFNQRQINSTNFTFGLQVGTQIKTFYLRTKTDIRTLITAHILSLKEINESLRINLILHYLFFGILLFAILYNLFLFFTTKNISFLFLSIYVLGWLGFNLTLSGHGLFLIWRDIFWFEKISSVLFTSVVSVSAILFMQNYLEMRTRYPLLYKILIFSVFPLLGFNFISYFFLPAYIAYFLLSLRAGIHTLLNLYIAVYATIKKDKNAILFLLAYFMIPVFNINTVLIVYGIISPNILSTWGGLISTIWLVIFLSFGLGYKYNILQKKMRRSQERFKLLNNSIMEGFFITDLNDTFVESNLAFQNMIKYSVEEVKKLKESDITPQRWRQEEKNTLNPDFYEKGYSDIYEKEFITKTDQLISVEIRKYVMKEKNKLSGYWAVVRDVSERKKLQNQLIHEHKMNSLGKLAGGIAHDMNNMLGGIMGFAEILKFGVNKDNYKKNQTYVDNIISITEKASHLNNKLLAFGRKAPMLKKEIDIHLIIEELFVIMERTLDKKIELKKDLNAPLHIIYGDPVLIQNALMNIVLNSRDAMPDGGQISITTEIPTLSLEERQKLDLKQDERAYVAIHISDSGTGIPVEFRNAIFEPFFTTKDIGKGTGLGLSAVYGNVKEHGGGITFESKTEIGTTFILYFPVYKASLIDPEKPDEALARGSGTILVGEDDEYLRCVFSTMLNQLGYTTIIMSDGEAVINFYKSHRSEIDLVLCDVIMPKKNGVEVFHELKKMDPEVKYILCSGFCSDHDIPGLLDEAVSEYIKKPFTLKEIAGTVYKVLYKQ